MFLLTNIFVKIFKKFVIIIINNEMQRKGKFRVNRPISTKINLILIKSNLLVIAYRYLLIQNMCIIYM
jgi:hypothetical protein